MKQFKISDLCSYNQIKNLYFTFFVVYLSECAFVYLTALYNRSITSVALPKLSVCVMRLKMKLLQKCKKVGEGRSEGPLMSKSRDSEGIEKRTSSDWIKKTDELHFLPFSRLFKVSLILISRIPNFYRYIFYSL